MLHYIISTQRKTVSCSVPLVLYLVVLTYKEGHSQSPHCIILLGTGVIIFVDMVVIDGDVVSAVLYMRQQQRRRNLTPGTAMCETV